MIGYSFWGFLGDVKYGECNQPISTPDGNSFYSWSIINELMKRGKKVVRLLDNRDAIGYVIEGRDLFKSFAQDARHEVYVETVCNSAGLSYNFDGWEYMLIEWRWPIPGRNTEADKGTINYQPDLENTIGIIEACNQENIPFIVFDLDYKLTHKDIEKYKIKYIVELGNKWENDLSFKGIAQQVKIPFDFSYMHDLPIKMECKNNLVYVGNRYERDWCIDKYIPEYLSNTIIYGNWLDDGKDSQQRWSRLEFGQRIQTRDMYDVYSSSVATILLAKKEYCDRGFMTARLLESICYGCVPLFIEEFGQETINDYAGEYANFLQVNGKLDVMETINVLRADMDFRKSAIKYLRNHLRFMDSKFFVDDIERMLRNEI